MNSKSKKRVFVGMSGGVDSSVAAFFLKRQGYDVVGVFMRCVSGELGRTIGNGPSTRLRADCTAEADATDARRVAEKLGIPFYVWDFEEEYKKRVVEYMVDGYRRGLTPNPDVMCNKEIKFGLFLERALAMGADYVATGHYVRIAHIAERRGLNAEQRGKNTAYSLNPIPYTLLAARDSNKDQSYFLWTLTQEQLKHCLFPIGDYVKPEVREIARKAGLPTADKKDSQGICFLGRVRLDDFLSQYIRPKVGQVRLVQNDGSYKVIGEHSGAQFYTIGQRHIGMANRGLTRLPVRSQAKAGNERGLTQRENMKPLYVAEKDIKANTLTVAEGSDSSVLYKKEILLRDVNFISPKTTSLIRANGGIRVMARVRYRQPLAEATLTFADSPSQILEQNLGGQAQTNAEKLPRRSASSPRRSALLVFEQGQKFVASGQSTVFYSASGEMLGGGIIL